ncbi:MAG: hypothetical protein KDK90_16340 [Leptospiraceae bacterium]|nr:hypothetical protein [Leptospiraceae bacterium]
MKKIGNVFILFILIFFTWYLLSPYLSKDTIPGWGIDPYFCVYVIKQVMEKFAFGIFPHQSTFWDIPMFFPSKHTLAFSDPFILQGILVYIFHKILSVDFFLSVNLAFAGFFLLNWMFCFLFYNVYVRSIFVSIVASWLWTFSLYFLAQSAHFQNTAAVGIVMTLYFSTKVNKKINVYTFLWIPISFLVLATSNLYNFVFTVYIIPPFWLFEIHRRFKNQSQKIKLVIIRNYLFSIIISIVLTLPIFYRYYETRKMYSEFSMQRNFFEQVYSSSRLIDYFTNFSLPPFYQNWLPLPTHFERNAFPGLFSFLFFVSSVLIFLYFWKYKKDLKYYSRQHINGMILTFLLFCLGVFLASGALLFPDLFQLVTHFVPGLSGLRAIGRAGMIVVLAECLGMGILLSLLSKQKKFTLLLLLCFMVGLQIFERLVPHFRHSQVNVTKSKIYNSRITNYLKQKSPESFGVLELSPDKEEQIKFSLERSLYHNHPILVGYSGFYPFSHEKLPKTYEFLQKCDSNNSEFQIFFKNTKYIIIHKNIQELPVNIISCLGNLGFYRLLTDSEEVLFTAKK